MKTKTLNLEGIKEVCLYCRDLEEAEHFYQSLLGLELIGSGNHFRFFKMAGQVLLIFNPDLSKDQTGIPPHFAFGNQHIAFQSTPEQYDHWKKRLLDGGIKIIHETEWPKSGFRSFYFLDPEEHVLEILEGDIWH